jgi:hypothetical protein
MFGELFRPLLRYLFWSRRRFLAWLTVLLILLGITARIAGCSAAGTSGHQAAAQAPSPATAAAPLPSASPAAQVSAPAGSQTSTAPAAPGPVPPQALKAAGQFMTAWVSRDPGRAARIRACATAQLAAAVTGPGAGYAPATALTGPVTVTGQAAGTVSLTVPTNAGPVLLTVRLAAGRWVAAQMMLARAGD